MIQPAKMAAFTVDLGSAEFSFICSRQTQNRDGQTSCNCCLKTRFCGLNPHKSRFEQQNCVAVEFGSYFQLLPESLRSRRSVFVQHLARWVQSRLAAEQAWTTLRKQPFPQHRKYNTFSGLTQCLDFRRFEAVVRLQGPERLH